MFGFKASVAASLVSIEAKLDTLLQKEIQMALSLDDIQAKVTAETTVTQSAVVLLQSLSAQIVSLKNSPAKLQALADSIDAQSTALAAAVAANTPAP